MICPCNSHGIKIKKEKFGSIRALTRMDMSVFTDVETIEVTIMRDQAVSLSHAIKKIDGHIEAIASDVEGYEGLVSIKGIGSRAAAIFLSGIGDVKDFATPDKLAAYVGIVPRVSQSNDTDKRGRITKRGSKLVRTTLVQCSLSAIRYSGYLNAFYQRIKAKRGSGKAIIATARKLLTIIYNTLKNGWVFEDFTTFTKRKNPFPTGQSS